MDGTNPPSAVRSKIILGFVLSSLGGTTGFDEARPKGCVIKSYRKMRLLFLVNGLRLWLRTELGQIGEKVMLIIINSSDEIGEGWGGGRFFFVGELWCQ